MAGKRIAREKKTISSMIALYQRRCPEARDDTEHYQALNAYADKRLDRCVFGEEKPACKQCPVHCYQPAKREEMKQIMRWAGPRMLWRRRAGAHPVWHAYFASLWADADDLLQRDGRRGGRHSGLLRREN